MTENIDWQQLRRVRLAVLFFYFCSGLCFSSWAGRIADIKLSMGLDNAAWGTILLMIPVGQVCGMTLSGYLVSKIGSRHIYPTALVGYSLALVVCGLSSNQYALIMSLIAFGFFANFCNIALNTQATIVETRYRRHIMASFHGAWSCAGFAGAAISLLMTGLDIHPFFHFGFIFLINMFVLFFNRRFLQEELVRKKVARDSDERQKIRPERFLFLLGFVAFFGMAAEGSIADWSGLYLIEVGHVAEKYAPLGLFAYMVTMAGGRFVIDRACEKWGQKKVVQVCGMLIASGLALIVTVPVLPVSIVAFMIVGLGTSSVIPIIYSIAGQSTKMSTGLAFTIVSSISFLGFLLGPPVIGFISNAYGLRAAYALIALFGVLITVFTGQIRVFRTGGVMRQTDGVKIG